MTRDCFNLHMVTLTNAFGVKDERMSNERLEIYWSQLQDIPDKRFNTGAKWCLTHLNFFPSIAELGAACYGGDLEWANRVVEHKRLVFERAKVKLLEEPMTDQERKAVRARVLALAIQHAEDMTMENPEPPTRENTAEQLAKEQKRREELKAQAKQLQVKLLKDQEPQGSA